MTKRILIISFLVYSTSIFAQDTLFQCDFSVNPIHFNKKYNGRGTETSIKSTRSITPTLTITLPIRNKYSFSLGLKLYHEYYERFFNDSIWQIIDPVRPEFSGNGSYIYHQKYTCTGLSFLFCLNYNLFYNKYFSTNISLGIEADTWNRISEYLEFYPISTTNNSLYNNNHLNSPIHEDIYSPFFCATLNYFSFKHFGLLVRPYISYCVFDDAIISYLGLGICYR